MRALRVVIADGGTTPRSDIIALCERAGFDVVGESPAWAAIAEIVATRSADVVLITGGPDFAKGALGMAGSVPTFVIAPDAAAAKEYGDAGVSAVLTPSAEPEVIAATVASVVARSAELREAHREILSLRDQLETRKLVERAKGVLMRRLGVDEDAAYRKIQRASQDENRKMRDIAESILSAERLLDGNAPAGSGDEELRRAPGSGALGAADRVQGRDANGEGGSSLR